MIEKQTINHFAEMVGFGGNLRNTHRVKLERLAQLAYKHAMLEAAEFVDANFYDTKTTAEELRKKAVGK